MRWRIGSTIAWIGGSDMCRIPAWVAHAVAARALDPIQTELASVMGVDRCPRLFHQILQPEPLVRQRRLGSTIGVPATKAAESIAERRCLGGLPGQEVTRFDSLTEERRA